MLYYLSECLTQKWGPFRLFQSHLFLISIGAFLAAFLTLFLLPRFWQLLPRDHGKAILGKDGMKSAGKPTGAGLVVTLVKKPGVKAKISFDGSEPVEEDLLLTTFANGCFCGGGFHSNPLASTTDGMIDSILVSNISRTRFISLVGDYKKGTHLCEKFADVIRHAKAKEVKLLFDNETNVCVDGEILRVKELVLSVLSGAINFLVPFGASPVSSKNTANEA